MKLINLSYISLRGYNIKNIDISKNLKLESVYLDDNKIESIDLSKNINLKTLSLSYNNLSSIDVSNNINLVNFFISYNRLSDIDVSKNTLLENLTVQYNKLLKLDVSKNTKLKQLGCDGNSIGSLDIRNNTMLRILSGYKQNIVVNLDSVKIEGNKYIIENPIKFNGKVITNIYGDTIGNEKDNEVIYDSNTNYVTIVNNSNSKIINYYFNSNIGNFDTMYHGNVTIDLRSTGVTVSSKNSTINIGDTQQLIATVTPDKALDKSVTWSTSDEKIAKVDQNGLVTAVGGGTATITVRTNDGGHIATSTITVNPVNQNPGNGSNSTQNSRPNSNPNNGNTNNNPSSNNIVTDNTTNPQTGVAGLSSILGIAGLGLCSLFASKKRKNK